MARTSATPQDTGPAVSASQIAEFHRDGFLVLPCFTTADDVRRIREIITGLYARFRDLPPRHADDLGDEAWHSGVQQIPEINWAARLAPELTTTLAWRRSREIASLLLGRRVGPTGFDHAILKHPHNERETPWHQDQAYTEDRGPLSSVHVWIPLQAVTPQMGCMEFIPGSHLWPILPHHRRGHRASAHVLEVDGVDASTAVACPLPLGGATVHLPRTLHRTGPNTTSEPRYAWSIEFGSTPVSRWRAVLGRR